MIDGGAIHRADSIHSFNPSFQGVSVYGWQTAGNIITLICGLIAAGLYGNIGIKVRYVVYVFWR
jgi:hypothetical protein